MATDHDIFRKLVVSLYSSAPYTDKNNLQCELNARVPKPYFVAN